MSKNYIQSAYNESEPLKYRYIRAAAQVNNVINRMTEASAAQDFGVAEKYALELLRTAEMAVQYYQSQNTIETVTSMNLKTRLGTWNPYDSVNELHEPSSYETGDYFSVTTRCGQFEVGDALVVDGNRWVHWREGGQN